MDLITRENNFNISEYDLKKLLLQLNCILRIHSYSNKYLREEISFKYKSIQGDVDCVIVKENDLYTGDIEYNNIAYELDSYDVKQLYSKVIAFIIENKFK